MSGLTDRQQRAFDRRTAYLNTLIERDGRGCYLLPSSLDDWSVRKDGRTTYLSYADSDHYAQIWFDPYGSGGDSLAALDWLHNENDEECPCGHNEEEQ